MNSSIAERVYGALFGFAIGDAMGATTEFMTKEQIAEQYGRVTEILGGGWLNLEPGKVTDDTQMTLCVYRAMREANGSGLLPTLRLVCRNFRAWADSNPPDIGGACKRAIYGIKGTEPNMWVSANLYRQRKSGVRDLGNGGLMRCLVPLLVNDTQLAIEQGYLTHSVGETSAFIDAYADIFYKAVLGQKDEELSTIQWMPSTGHVQNTFHNAAYWFDRATSFEGAVTDAVNDGGDADTIAALTGALAGAYYGFKAIPGKWIRQLDPEVVTELCECAEWVLEKLQK